MQDIIMKKGRRYQNVTLGNPGDRDLDMCVSL